MRRKGLPPDSLSAGCFSVFGLGDSSYPKFNYTAKKLQKRLVRARSLEVVFQKALIGTRTVWVATCAQRMLILCVSTQCSDIAYIRAIAAPFLPIPRFGTLEDVRDVEFKRAVV
jgi:hypothetical protein